MENSRTPFAYDAVQRASLELNRPDEYADIVMPPDSGDNEPLHVIEGTIDYSRATPQELLILGSKHRSDSGHWYYRDYLSHMTEWEKRTRDMGRRVLIREGAASGPLLNEHDVSTCIEMGSDGGVTSAVAWTYDIPLVWGDFPHGGDLVAVAELYPDRIEEIITYYTMREIPVYARNKRPMLSFEVAFKQRLELIRSRLGRLAMSRYVPATLDFSYDTVVDLHRKFFNGEDPNVNLTDTYLDYTVANIHKDLRHEPVARIATDRMNLSDGHLLLTIRHYLEQGNDVMVTFGNHHTLSIARPIERLLGEHRPSAQLSDAVVSRSIQERIASWNEPRQKQDFQGGVLVYPPKEWQPVSPETLDSFMIPAGLTEDHLCHHQYIWPNLVPDADSMVPDARQAQAIKALADFEATRQFEGNEYLASLCREPMEYRGDGFELARILDHIAETIEPDPNLLGDNKDLQGLQHYNQLDLAASKDYPSLDKILTTAEKRLKCVFGEEYESEATEWFVAIGTALERIITENGLSVTQTVDRVNMATKQVAALCKLFRDVPAFNALGLTANEQCCYALGFLTTCMKKETWPIKRLDRIARLPYHIFHLYLEECFCGEIDCTRKK